MTPKNVAAQTAINPRRRRNLPGDGVVLATRAMTVAANAAGLGIAMTGRALLWPRLPIGIAAGITFFDYQPWLRRVLDDRIGTPAADTVMTLVMAASQTLSQSPTSLSIGLTMQSLKAAECRAEAQAWELHEPDLARHADQPPIPLSSQPPRSKTMERNARRFAFTQALSAGLIGAGTRNVTMAATAVQVTTPKASRTTPEAFATTLGRGLAQQHAVLALRPASLRLLKKVDAIVIDPRVLCTDTLRVAGIRGADESELAAAWNRAQLMLEKTQHPTGLARGTRDVWQPRRCRNQGKSGGAFPAHTRSTGLRRGRRGTPHRGRARLGRRRLAGRPATGVRRSPARSKAGPPKPLTTRSPTRWPTCGTRDGPSHCCHRLPRKRFHLRTWRWAWCRDKAPARRPGVSICWCRILRPSGGCSTRCPQPGPRPSAVTGSLPAQRPWDRCS